jgi:hypothetical protein
MAGKSAQNDEFAPPVVPRRRVSLQLAGQYPHVNAIDRRGSTTAYSPYASMPPKQTSTTARPRVDC